MRTSTETQGRRGMLGKMTGKAEDAHRWAEPEAI